VAIVWGVHQVEILKSHIYNDFVQQISSQLTLGIFGAKIAPEIPKVNIVN